MARPAFNPLVLRGGLHFGLWRWQYSVHKRPLITIKQGKLGYVFSRAGEALGPSQTLGRVVDCNHFQDVQAFLASGQKGRQRAILREGVYAINLAAFNVITEDGVYSIDRDRALAEWQQRLREVQGFDPVVVGSSADNQIDNIGIVTTQDGPSLEQGEIIAPPVGMDRPAASTITTTIKTSRPFWRPVAAAASNMPRCWTAPIFSIIGSPRSS